MSSRAQRRREADEAQTLQTKAAVLGGARWTIGGLGTATVAHYFWPLFRAQTLPFKGFLVTICTVFGMVTNADKALLNYERHKRKYESEIRNEARMDLARRGLVPTETEILKWKEENISSDRH